MSVRETVARLLWLNYGRQPDRTWETLTPEEREPWLHEAENVIQPVMEAVHGGEVTAFRALCARTLAETSTDDLRRMAESARFHVDHCFVHYRATVDEMRDHLIAAALLYAAIDDREV